MNFIFLTFIGVWTQCDPFKVNMTHLLCTRPIAFILRWMAEKWNLFLKLYTLPVHWATCYTALSSPPVLWLHWLRGLVEKGRCLARGTGVYHDSSACTRSRRCLTNVSRTVEMQACVPGIESTCTIKIVNIQTLEIIAVIILKTVQGSLFLQSVHFPHICQD